MTTIKKKKNEFEVTIRYQDINPIQNLCGKKQTIGRSKKPSNKQTVFRKWKTRTAGKVFSRGHYSIDGLFIYLFIF